jgi:hypothetical protein
LLPEFGEPFVPGVLDDGGWLASGDFGTADVPAPEVAAPAPVEVDEPPEAFVPEVLPEALLSRFALRSCFERFWCLVVAPVVLSVEASVLAPVLALAPAFGLVLFESTLALVEEPAVALVSFFTDESAANTLKEIAARLLRAKGRNLRIVVSMERKHGDSSKTHAYRETRFLPRSLAL